MNLNTLASGVKEQNLHFIGIQDTEGQKDVYSVLHQGMYTISRICVNVFVEVNTHKCQNKCTQIFASSFCIVLYIFKTSVLLKIKMLLQLPWGDILEKVNIFLRILCLILVFETIIFFVSVYKGNLASNTLIQTQCEMQNVILNSNLRFYNSTLILFIKTHFVSIGTLIPVSNI